jgi:hypothetical protein
MRMQVNNLMFLPEFEKGGVRFLKKGQVHRWYLLKGQQNGAFFITQIKTEKFT